MSNEALEVLAQTSADLGGYADHWSDCATNNFPAYPAGPCDCMPTPAMCRAAVEYLNGAGVYNRLPREVLDIEESIYREVWLAMEAKRPNPS